MPSLSTTPLLSFIVLSYNYENYIADTLTSILAQSVQDFEIVVVDDASTDNSRSVVESFSDPRIRLFHNEINIGGARSYNRAVELARGEWLVNLDADDWISPDKSAKQLAVLAADPSIDIIGSYVAFFDGDGRPHPDSSPLEEYVNSDVDLNLLDSWIGRNRLCRSSTMVRRSAHLRIGLDDPDMVRAPDYELWTRALRLGCRFHVIPEKLTAARIQHKGVTHGDPLGTTLEKAWIGIRNLRPHAEALAAWPSFEKLIETVVSDTNLASLTAAQRHRLLASLFMDLSLESFAQYKLFLDQANPQLEATGKRMLAFTMGKDSHKDQLIEKLTRDIRSYIEARDHWQGIVEGTFVGSNLLRVRRLVGYIRRRWVSVQKPTKQ